MFYQDNMQAMKEGKKTLFELFQQKEVAGVEEQLSVRSVPAKTGALSLEVEKNETLTRLNSKYDPKQEAQRWAEQYRAKNLDTIVVMFGLGNGIFLRELLNKLEHYQYIIVYEPSYTIFCHVLEYYSLSDLFRNEKILLVVERINDYEFPYFLSRLVTWMNMYSQIKCQHPGYDKLFQDSFKSYISTIQDNLFTSIVSKNTSVKLGKWLAANTILNTIHLRDSISYWDLVERIPKDIPVIIVSAGPSLNKNIEALKAAKGKSIIMAVDKAYLSLLKHQIEPDFVVHIDALKTIESCGNQPGFTTPLLSLLEGSRRILNDHKGRKVIYDCSEFIRKIYNRLGHPLREITTGGSVSTAAFALCALARFHRIIMVGSNLAYLGGVSHAGEEYRSSQVNDELELYVEDIEGNPIRTRYDWYTFLRWYESAILQMEEFDVINATEGGANIKGTRNMRLQDAVKQYCTVEFNCSEVIEAMEPTFSEQDIVTIREYLTEAREDIEEIMTRVRKIILNCEKLITEIKLNKNYYAASRRFLEAVTETNEFVESKAISALINQFVLSIGSDEIEQLNFISTDSKRDEIQSYTSTANVYHRIIEACEYLAQMLDYTIPQL